MDNFILQMEPCFGEEEKQAVVDYMDAGGWFTEFKKTQQFEAMIAEFTGAKHCIIVNNGTISLTLAALALGIKAGDEVIVPNYTMIATPNSLKLIGAEPVFVDVEPETLCIDINELEKKITSKTKAIILVAANGRFPDYGIDALLSLIKKYDLNLIEDAAQALGSFYPDGSHIGTVGAIGSISFSAPKIISTGQGGALITNDDKLAEKIRKYKDFGRAEGGNDIHDTLGWNFKFTDLQACVGIEQMRKLPARIKRKKEIYSLFRECLKGCEGISFFKHDLENTTPWFNDVLAENRDDLQTWLKKKNIGTRVMYPPVNKQRAYDLPGEYPVSNRIGQDGLWLPSSIKLTDGQVAYICEEIKSFYNSCNK
jgi:perosamine synthetase